MLHIGSETLSGSNRSLKFWTRIMNSLSISMQCKLRWFAKKTYLITKSNSATNMRLQDTMFQMRRFNMQKITIFTMKVFFHLHFAAFAFAFAFCFKQQLNITLLETIHPSMGKIDLTILLHRQIYTTLFLKYYVWLIANKYFYLHCKLDAEEG